MLRNLRDLQYDLLPMSTKDMNGLIRAAFCILTSMCLLCPTTGKCEFKTSVYHELHDSGNFVWKQLRYVTEASCIRCGTLCSTISTNCIAFAISRENCILLGGFTNFPGEPWVNWNGEWIMFGLENATIEMPVFRVSSGSGVSVYNTWLSGNPSTLNASGLSRDLDLGLSVTSYYKHPLIDNWNKWTIAQGILSLYTSSDEVIRVQFSAANTSSTSWFSLSHLISSPWTDLGTEVEINYFCFDLGLANHYRRFYINSEFGGCPADKGWLVVFDGPDVCDWSMHLGYPSIQYATNNQRQRPADDAVFKKADDLLISVVIQL